MVERRDKRWGSWIKAGTTKGMVTSLDVTGLTTGLEYLFRVAAENEEGFGPATEMTESVTPSKEPGQQSIFQSVILSKQPEQQSTLSCLL